MNVENTKVLWWEKSTLKMNMTFFATIYSQEN